MLTYRHFIPAIYMYSVGFNQAMFHGTVCIIHHEVAGAMCGRMINACPWLPAYTQL